MYIYIMNSETDNKLHEQEKLKEKIAEAKKQVSDDLNKSTNLDKLEKSNASDIETIERDKENEDYIVKAGNFVDANIKTPYKIKDFFKTNNLLFGEDIDAVISVINNEPQEKEEVKRARLKLMTPLIDHYKSEDMKKTKRYVDYGKDFTKKEQRELNIEMDKINIKDEGYKIKEKEKLIEAAEKKRQQELMSEMNKRPGADMPSIGIKILPAVPLNVVNTELDLGAVVNYFNGFQGLDLETIFKASKKYSSAQKDKLADALDQIKEKLPRGIDYTDEELEKALLKQKLDINKTIIVLGLELEKKLKNNYVRRNRKREKLNKELAETNKKLREAIKSNDKSLEKKLMERKEDIKKTLEKTIKEQEEESKSDAAKEQAKKWAEKAHKNETLLKEHFKEYFPEAGAEAYKEYLYDKNAGDGDTEKNQQKLQDLIELEMKRKEAVMYKKQSKDESDAAKNIITDIDRQIPIVEATIKKLNKALTENRVKKKAKEDNIKNATIEDQNNIAEEIAELTDDIENNEKEIEAERKKLKKLQDLKTVKDNFNRQSTIISNELKENADKEAIANIQKIEAEAKVAAVAAAKKKADEERKAKAKEKADADAKAEADKNKMEETKETGPADSKENPIGGKKTRNKGRTYLKKTRRKRV